jgi:D-alanyl-D-alanine carboxypeptidase/D-alanyl-D-alanine-endopeptidase (penicillin-binding protein 4)
MSSRSRWVLLALFLPNLLLASDLDDDLGKRLDRVRRRFRLNRAIGLVVQSVETGETLYSHNGDKKFIPASGMKLVTMASALHYLGPNYRFETKLLVDGPLENGVLKANLYVKGSGDPFLTEGDLETITETIAKAGLKEITGNLILDDSFFDDRLRGPASYDNILKKGLPIQSALSYNFNIVELRAKPAEKVGARADLYDGGYGYFEVLNRVKTSSRGRPWMRVKKLRRDRVVVYGRVVAGDEEETSGFVAPDPTHYFASAFLGKLKEKGVLFYGDVVKATAPGTGLKTLYVHRSARLIQILELLGKDSNNFVAEQLLKALGAHRWGGPGSFENGAKALSEYLIGLGFRKEDFRISDGSGLSYENSLSSSILVRVIQELYSIPELRTDFICSLAVGGVDGTLSRRFRREEHMGQVIAKTGSLAGISSLSGIAFTQNRGPLVFSVMLNGIRRQWRADHVEDEIARVLLQY